MRFGMSERWLTAVVGALVLTAAVPVVFSTLSVGGPLPAYAADEIPSTPDPALVPIQAADGEEEAEAKVDGEEKTDENSTSENSTDENIAGETDGDEKPVAEQGSNGQAADEKIPEEKIEDPDSDDQPKIEKDIAKSSVNDRGPTNNIPSRKESFLTWLYQSLGTRYVVIFLLITFNAVALIVMIVLGLRRSIMCPEELSTAFEAKLNEKKYQEAYELAKQDRSFLGKVLTAGMARLPEGYEAAQEAMQEVGEEQNMRLEQRNGYIALIAQIGPMIGLLGTVDGMVMAFDVIAHSNVTPKPSELAQGIGTALVTTVVGLWIAIPTLTFYHIIRNHLSRLMSEVGTISGNLMRRFATVQISPKKS